MNEQTIHRQNIIAVIWDFDKTLINGYMQRPIFQHFDVDEEKFWREVNALPAFYEKQRGQRVSSESVYLNHILTYIKTGKLKGLNNQLLKELGKELTFYPGLPDFFETLKAIPQRDFDYKKHNIMLEHYIISTGLAAMIRGSEIASYVENIYGCELVEAAPLPGFLDQDEFLIDEDREISQIGSIVDNTIKTRFIFEINKGTNKIPDIDVNSKINPEHRRVPIKNMIYVADGPSDIPVFSVVKKHGGKTFAVHEPNNEEEFIQNDTLLQNGRVDAYGRADYREGSETHMWLKTHIKQICDRIVREQEISLARNIGKPPRHIHPKLDTPPETTPQQSNLFE